MKQINLSDLQIQEIHQEWNNSKKRILIISNKGSIFVDIVFSSDNRDTKIELWGFYVDIDNRNKGVGKALLHYAEKVASRYSNRIEIQ